MGQVGVHAHFELVHGVVVELHVADVSIQETGGARVAVVPLAAPVRADEEMLPRVLRHVVARLRNATPGQARLAVFGCGHEHTGAIAPTALRVVLVAPPAAVHIDRVESVVVLGAGL